jgi:hypothetical protein
MCAPLSSPRGRVGACSHNSKEWCQIAEATLPKYTPKGPISPANEIAYGQELFGELNRLRDLVRDQHGRVLVLSIASFAEECLARLIKAYLRNTKAVDELLEGFNAPLGTFAARIKIASALGLLSGSQFKNLEIMRKKSSSRRLASRFPIFLPRINAGRSA